ncbi:MAG TPA: hypothetical protein VFE17_07560 [Candidatus Baltobacteraceae bacterium]|jgi:hypothetical protein|nr:hypothetical protein [Candidatus Baltobacteraceae bacterium]
MRGQASLAIILARLRRERRVALVAMAGCGLVAYFQRLNDEPARLAAALVFGALTAIVIALLQRGSGRFRELELTELTAPLYGRELARATAAVPCLLLTAAMFAYWTVASVYRTPSLSQVAVAAFSSYAAALVAMCATVRRGIPRTLYIVLACAVAGAAFAIAQNDSALALLFCTICGFTALRQYGEALARYDPV